MRTSERMRVDAEHPEKDIAGTYHISYSADERVSTTPKDSYTKPSHMQVLLQFFNFSQGSLHWLCP